MFKYIYAKIVPFLAKFAWKWRFYVAKWLEFMEIRKYELFCAVLSTIVQAFSANPSDLDLAKNSILLLLKFYLEYLQISYRICPFFPFQLQ
jgi:hypothetical protein